VDEGMAIYIEKMLDAGISESDVERMVRRNPVQLLGARERVAAAGGDGS
jgi:hypothetical protein